MIIDCILKELEERKMRRRYELARKYHERWKGKTDEELQKLQIDYCNSLLRGFVSIIPVIGRRYRFEDRQLDIEIEWRGVRRGHPRDLGKWI